MTKITPVGSAEDHVQTKDGNSGRVVVLVEDPLLLVVDKLVALRPVSDSRQSESDG